MVQQISGIYKLRKDQKLCRDCGTRPRYWGQRCVICRQSVSKNPLPRAARTALRKYREQEAQCQRAKTRETVRTAAREVVAKGNLTEREEEALTLYLGLDDNVWRTYKEVAQLMHLSGERVRQLLSPSREALALSLGNCTPWGFEKRTSKQNSPSHRWSMEGTSPRCQHRHAKVFRQSVVYIAAGLPNVTLQGLPVSICPKCDVKKCPIPRQAELHNKLARVLLARANLLSGQEIRFLRTVAGLNATEFAQRLNVTRQTVQKWEAGQALRLANEIAARIVLATLILDADLSSQTLKLPDTTPKRGPEHSTITAEWVETAGCWKIHPQ